MKILLTGCFGFIGSNLLSSLLNEGHEVVGFDNLVNPSLYAHERVKQASGKNWENLRFHKIDIRDAQHVKQILISEQLIKQIDAVIHLAAMGSVPRSFDNPSLTMSVNDVGFVTIMQAMKEHNIKHIVFASSSSVYGANQEIIKTEGFEGRALSPYALSKQMNERFAEIWAKQAGINYVGLRFFNVYGPGQLVDSPYSAVIPRFINAETPEIFGDGYTIRDFTFVEDVVDAIHLSLEYVKEKSGIFNVGCGEMTSLNTIVQYLKKNPTYTSERPNDVKVSCADIDKARIFLGFKAKTNIKEGLQKTVAFYKGLKNVGL